MKNKGFTLIELVVVIVILGILAVTAVPKFVNLEAEAHTATLKAVKASLEGGAALVYGKSLVKGNHKENFTFFNVPTIDLADGPLTINYGYPLAQITSWNRIIDYDSSHFSSRKTTDGKTLMFYIEGNEVPSLKTDNCIVHYSEPANVGDKPQIGMNECV